MTTRKKDDGAPGNPAQGSATFEESLRRLEHIVDVLEKGEVPLDDAIRLYEEGIRISQECARKLSDTELILKRLGKDLEGNFTLLDDDTDA